MFCIQCANPVEEHARFCSKCGHELTPARSVQARQHDMTMHVNVLAWIYIGCGILTGIVGFVMLFASRVITQFPIPWPPEMPPAIVPLIGSIVVFAGVVTIAISGGIAAAGIGLMQYRNWGRILAAIMAAFLVLHFPVGTAIAVYTFWVLFSEEGRNHYKTRSAAAAAQVAHA
jgi:predicted nucleic acid-binding Zn ribbon protein